jgi:hypothetical protein
MLRMTQKKWTARLRRFGDEDDRYWLSLSPSQRVGMMWDLTVEGWQLEKKRDLTDAERCLRRDLVRVVRRGR